MEEIKEIPTPINSFYVIPKLHTNHFDINKKRKLPDEQLGLPMRKHKHFNESFRSEHVFAHGGQRETGQVNVHLMKGNTDEMCFDEGSEPESAIDSNSFNEETDSATSVSCGAKFESFSSQSISFGGVSSESTQFPHSSTAMGSSFSDHDDILHKVHELEDHPLESGNHEENSCAEFGIDSTEHSTDQELEELLYSNGLNPNMYVLSSGRWTVNQEAQSETRSPTIDQEFEQYFSMLML